MFDLLHKNKNECSLIEQLPIEEIVIPYHYPRKYQNKKSLSALVDSIAQYGILNPILVTFSENQYRLLSGKRRLEAAVLLHMTEVPAIIVSCEENAMLLFLVENTMRENITFLETAKCYEYFIQKGIVSKNNLAKTLHISKKNISEKLRLTKLHPLVLKLIQDFHLSEKHAQLLSKIRDKDKQIRTANIICIENMDVEKTRAFLQMCHLCEDIYTSVQKASGFRNIKLLLNTLRETVDILNQQGLSIDFTEVDSDDRHTITIDILHEPTE